MLAQMTSHEVHHLINNYGPKYELWCKFLTFWNIIFVKFFFLCLSFPQWSHRGSASVFRVAFSQSVRSVRASYPATAQISPQSSL